MEKRRILIVDNNDELRILEQALEGLGHEVVISGERETALRRNDLDSFDLIISDLADEEVRAFKMGAANYLRLPYNRDELREIVEQTLAHKLRYVDDPRLLPNVHEMIEFELPSDLALMNGILEYLQERVAKLGLIRPERSNLFIALDEAFVNAVKHGNKNDPSKLLKITAELSAKGTITGPVSRTLKLWHSRRREMRLTVRLSMSRLSHAATGAELLHAQRQL